ncbi:MAG TPA: STAS/SEC14 domain-containing protein [Rhizobiaceae bacterium]|nr:STAS/SEC14 domain-containing protein [Rhizobiaceae bacterium]
MRDPIHHIPVIRRLETPREDLFAFEIVGHITQADIANVYGLLEEAYERHDEIDLLVRISDWEGFDWSAIFADGTWAAKTNSLKHIRRYALVGGPGWLRGATAALAPFFSMQIRCFALEDERDSWTWLEQAVGRA